MRPNKEGQGDRPVILDLGGKNLAIIRGKRVTSTDGEEAIRAALEEIFAPLRDPAPSPTGQQQ